MYQNFYNLKKESFHITPDPEFLFLSPSHKQALGSIIYGVEKGKGFIVITGEIGVGKTTILRSYLEGVNKKQLKIISIFNANVSFKGLLKMIYQELGLSAQTDDVFEMVNRLHEVMIGEYKQGHTVVLIIDEAQNMPVETLENLRMLSNLETSKDKLLQIVLVGQPEFVRILNVDQLRQLNQRIAIRSTIIPFTKEESIDYIKHRLAMVAIDDTQVFTKGALKKIVREAKGIPRNINILCDNALITGFGYKKKPVNTKIVREVIADFGGKAKPSLLRWVLAPTALILLIAGLFLIYPYRGLFLSKLSNPELSRTATQNPIREEIKPSVEKPGPPQTDQTEPPKKEIEISTAEKIPEKTSSAIIRIVKKGDNLFRLTKEVYGYADDKLVEGVKQSNPRIKDVNRILVGEEIVFPEIVGSQVKDKVKVEGKDNAKAKAEAKAKVEVKDK